MAWQLTDNKLNAIFLSPFLKKTLILSQSDENDKSDSQHPLGGY